MRARQSSCAFTGHRPEKLPWGYDETDTRCVSLKKRLSDAVENAYRADYTHFICGMAKGCDMYFGEIVAEMKRKYPDITLEAAIPCPTQTQNWTEEQRARYGVYHNGKRVKIEIKQNASEIATIDKNGNINSVLLKADYVIYAPEYSPAYAVECQAYVLDAKQFIDLLSENGLIRYKMSSAQYKKAENERWHDRITIQSLNSKARYNRMYDLLEEYGTLLKEWA